MEDHNKKLKTYGDPEIVTEDQTTRFKIYGDQHRFHWGGITDGLSDDFQESMDRKTAQALLYNKQTKRLVYEHIKPLILAYVEEWLEEWNDDGLFYYNYVSESSSESD